MQPASVSSSVNEGTVSTYLTELWQRLNELLTLLLLNKRVIKSLLLIELLCIKCF